MKRFSILLFLAFFCSAVFAQTDDDFQQFRQKMLGDYQQFRKSVLDDYDKYLEGIWKGYESFTGLKRQEKPKPATPPDINDTPVPEQPEKQPADDIPEGDVPDYNAPVPDTPEEKPAPTVPHGIPMTTIPFYGTTLKVPVLNCVEAGNMESGKIARVWRTYNGNGTKDVARALHDEAMSRHLNDWFTYELVRECVNGQCRNSSAGAKVILQHYILANMGYNVRLALQHGNALLLIPVCEKIYARTFVMIDGKNYYEFDSAGHDGERGGEIYTCELPKDAYCGSSMDFVVRNGLDMSSGSHHECTLSYGDMSITTSVDTGIMEMLRHYPQMDIPYFAASVIQRDVREDVLNQLKPYIKDLPEVDAANKLLHFVQHAFRYSTDQEQHGYEKTYFFEENFYYPKNDCEDRAIFFAYLVHSLLGLDVHLVQFPGHECTAVNFTASSPSGDSYTYNGSTYTFCDPTYIGSNVGQCMPTYRNSRPKIEKWY